MNTPAPPTRNELIDLYCDAEQQRALFLALLKATVTAAEELTSTAYPVINHSAFQEARAAIAKAKGE